MSAVHAAQLQNDAFGAQTFCLFPVREGGFRKHDAAAGADDAMPWKVAVIRCGSQCESGQACAAGQAGGSRDRPVSGHLAARDGANHLPDRLNRRIIFGGARTPRPRVAGARRQHQIGQ